MRKNQLITLGIIVGNRNFFPDALVAEGRREVLEVLAERNIKPVILDEQSTKLGGVETWQDAKKCAALFDEQRHRINGILVVLPNFGDEKGIAETIKLSGLNVPILIQAYPDDLTRFSLDRRRDAFCGKISVCNNLYQYGIPFSITKQHTVFPKSDAFKADLDEFVAVCRVVDGMRRARLGAVGARPNAFNTTRYSEKLLQAFGISVSTVDLSEVFGSAGKIGDDDRRVKERLDAIGAYVPTSGIPAPSLVKMSKLGIVLDDWMHRHGIDATAILGDQPLVTLTALQASFHPEPSSSTFVTRPAPTINENGSYEDNPKGRCPANLRRLLREVGSVREIIDESLR